MSKKQQNILISPPLFIDSNNKERIVSKGHNCSYCNGRGWFWQTNTDGEEIKTNCRICNGTGKLNAVITIEWEPGLNK
ncbi:hypothetical protein [Phocaeicola paurosaccharolyticus]|uniref:hypothetical protein n=1 Tax=Phocaeicola paurosaccharolyticus TaxID=732242 RepID=UPI002FE0DE9F